ncbi:MAG: Uma2 family endonuclease [Leptolyngbyaceae cyanobacterium SL_7_1]|nr:Uma2 family endonuclease [Leptolyngbyaceae cyanobacterium SL_7_1]
MPAPLLVMEVVSPGQTNRTRDYEDKRAQYQMRGILEYWLLDPEQQVVIVLALVNGVYQERQFQSSSRIVSPLFPAVALTAEQVLNPVE